MIGEIVKMKSALLELYCESIDKFEEFTTIIENSTVSLSLIGENLYIQIDSDLDDREIENLLLNLYSMIFLYLGYFPKIITFEIENTVIDISNLSGKYTTSKQFEKKYYQIITINSNSITQDIYNKFVSKTSNNYAINSMQAVISEDYEHVMSDHKLLITLHCVDGIYENKGNNRFVKKLIEIMKVTNDKLQNDDLMQSLFSLFGCGNIDEMAKRLKDTRHWYSHLMNTSDKKFEKTFKDMLEFHYGFQFLYYVQRIYIIDSLDCKIDVDCIKKFINKLIIAFFRDKTC